MSSRAPAPRDDLRLPNGLTRPPLHRRVVHGAFRPRVSCGKAARPLSGVNHRALCPGRRSGASGRRCHRQTYRSGTCRHGRPGGAAAARGDRRIVRCRQYVPAEDGLHHVLIDFRQRTTGGALRIALSARQRGADAAHANGVLRGRIRAARPGTAPPSGTCAAPRRFCAARS